MKTDQKTTRRHAAKQAKPKPAARGKNAMGKSETVPLAIAAKAALDFQIHLGNEEDGTDFKTWRHAQVKAVVGREGLTDCDHDHFRPLLAHFKMLAGKDEKALELHMRSGKVTSSGAPDDTREAREHAAYEIMRRLFEHIQIADTAWPQLLEIFAEDGRDDKWVNKAMDRKLAIEKEGGPIREGYLVAIVRQKTRRPDLKLGPDLRAGLAERCTVRQLRELLSTLVNRINAKEGVGSTGRRNKKQGSKPEKARRSRKTLAPRFELPFGEEPQA